MRTLTVVVLALALAACGEPAPNADAPAASANGNASVILSNSRTLPDWLLIARQRSCDPGEQCPRGEVHYNQRTVTRNAADNTADIWIQVRHGSAQLYQLESETTETTIRYELERLHYRFKCDTGEFIVVERQIIGANETVIATDTPQSIYRAPVRGSATGIIQPIACRGG